MPQRRLGSQGIRISLALTGIPPSPEMRCQFEAIDPQFTTDTEIILIEVKGHPVLRRPPPMTVPPKLQNARKYCEFHDRSGHTTTECRELKKALHELADKGKIDRFLKRGRRYLRQEQEPAQAQPQDEECSMEVMATVAGGYTKGITQSAWKA